jgi:hypothetical protein
VRPCGSSFDIHPKRRPLGQHRRGRRASTYGLVTHVGPSSRLVPVMAVGRIGRWRGLPGGSYAFRPLTLASAGFSAALRL